MWIPEQEETKRCAMNFTSGTVKGDVLGVLQTTITGLIMDLLTAHSLTPFVVLTFLL